VSPLLVIGYDDQFLKGDESMTAPIKGINRKSGLLETLVATALLLTAWPVMAQQVTG
jgi:hypothetical protein